MSDETYQQTLDNAIQELSDLLEEREALEERREIIDHRTRKVRSLIMSVAELLGDDVYGDLMTERPELFPELFTTDSGFTDSVRKVLLRTNSYYSPVEIREGLKKEGFDITGYRNILASIHAILKRLEKRGEVKAKVSEGKTVYKWAEHPPSMADVLEQKFSHVLNKK